jgi:hypothetical protein
VGLLSETQRHDIGNGVDGLSLRSTHPTRSANQSIVIGMRADPEPEIAVVHFDGERAIAQADAGGPVTSDFLELQRRMARIAFEKSKIGVGQLSDRERQRFIGGPEFR